jgi:hypothetical protein
MQVIYIFPWALPYSRLKFDTSVKAVTEIKGDGDEFVTPRVHLQLETSFLNGKYNFQIDFK